MKLNIKIKTGCDLVDLRKFRKVLNEGGETFMTKVFTEQELISNSSIESKAGVFALKEAVIKALNLPNQSWKNIEVSKEKSGKPVVDLIDTDLVFISEDISISHDGDYALAVAVFLIES